MRKSLLQRISEETGCDLTPIGVARDRRLRALYEAYMEAKDESEKEAAYEAFVKFVREEYQ
jgi:hypothetical protein